MKRIDRLQLYRRSRPLFRQEQRNARPHLEEMESRCQPSLLSLSVAGGITINLPLGQLLHQELGQNVPVSNIFRSLESSPAAASPTAASAPGLEIRLLQTPRAAAFTILITELPTEAQPVQPGPSSPGSNPSQNVFPTFVGPQLGSGNFGSGSGTPAFGQPSAQASAGNPATTAGVFTSQTLVPNFFMEFAPNASAGGQVTPQPGFVSLVPNFFFQNGANAGPQGTSNNPVVPFDPTISRLPPSAPVPASLQAGRALFGAIGNELTANVGAAIDEQDQDEATPAVEEIPPPDELPTLPNPQGIGDARQLDEMFLVPVAGVGSNDLRQGAGTQPSEPFWTAIADQDYRLLPAGQEGGRVGLAGALAASLLALVPEWMPPPDNRRTVFGVRRR